jgi:hypothetical protein
MRGVRFFVLPSLYIAPILSVWFRFLEKVGGNPKLIPLKKVLIDQVGILKFESKPLSVVLCSAVLCQYNLQFANSGRILS